VLILEAEKTKPVELRRSSVLRGWMIERFEGILDKGILAKETTYIALT
jgi:hypothetical protein